jgi:hypothetical protein
LDVLDVLAKENAAPWVRGIFLEKLDFQVPASEYAMQNDFVLSHMPNDQFERYVAVLRRLPEGPYFARQHLEEIQRDEAQIEEYGYRMDLRSEDSDVQRSRAERLELYHALQSLAAKVNGRTGA